MKSKQVYLLQKVNQLINEYPVCNFIRESEDWSSFEMVPLEQIECKSPIESRIDNLQNKLNKEGFTQWKKQRQSINRFFQNANYQDINISQKTFPIPDLKINEPQGTDLQIRGDNPQKPIRNKITTYHAARLMYEIATQQAVAPEYSQKMLNLLTRDLRREAWKFDPPNPDEFNPVENFLGEGVAEEKVQFASILRVFALCVFL